MIDHRPERLSTLSQTSPDQLPAELAPFVAKARVRIEHDTHGLAPDAAIQRLEATVARAAVEASRLGLRFPGPEAEAPDPSDLADGQGPVVIVRRLVDPGESA